MRQPAHPAEAKSVTELCDLVIAAAQQHDAVLLQATIGTIGILIGTITRQGKSDTLRAAFREIAQTCSVSDTRKILKAAKVGLTVEQAGWLDSQLASIAEGTTEAE